MHKPPVLPYSGLTIILSNASRFDTKELLSGYAGDFLWQKLAPINKYTVDVQELKDHSGFLPGTKIVLLLGSYAMANFIPLGNTLSQQRGYPYEKDGIIFISSFAPQDAMDMQDYEKRFNAKVQSDDDDEDEGKDDTEKHTKGRTQRENFRFWLEQDCKRVVLLLHDSSKFFLRPICPNPIIRPSLKQVSDELRSLDSEASIYLDIETEPKTFNLWCISIGIDCKSMPFHIYTIPIFRYNYALAYDAKDISIFFSALAIAMHNCTIVIHNTSFDLFVLAWRYHIAFGRKVYDTMLAQARKYPGVEKSLGHCMSIYTYEPYHKNEGVFSPKSEAQELQLWTYNAKDVWGMYLIRKSIDASATPLEAASIAQVNASVYPYLLMTLFGIRYMPSEVERLIRAGDARMEQMLRCIKLLVGYTLLPSSNKQMVKYFHEELGLPVVARSKITSKPSLAKDAFYKLYNKYEHPVIPFCMEFRSIQKETSSLAFNPWYNWRDKSTPGSLLHSSHTFRDTSNWKLSGADTFRASASKLFSFIGGNRQNVAKNLRKIYKPDPGKILCQVDQSGAEALIVAYLCRPGNFLDLFLHKIKPHVFVALHRFRPQFEEIYGKSLAPYTSAKVSELPTLQGWTELNKLIKSSDKWEPSKRYYYMAKMVCHASNYGMEANALCLNVLIKSEGVIRFTLNEAQDFLNIYHALFPEIREWHKEVELCIRIHKKLKNLFGYPCYFFRPLEGNKLKEALAFIPQSTVGCITHIAITKMQEYIESTGVDWDILNNCHDSFLVQCPKAEAKACCTKMQEFLNADLENFKGEKFKMRSEAMVGSNWCNMYE